jgi:hypothetical protein
MAWFGEDWSALGLGLKAFPREYKVVIIESSERMLKI